MIRLEKPAILHKNLFEKSLQAIKEDHFDYFFIKDGFIYEQWILEVNRTENIPENWVPTSFFFAINSDNEIDGRISIRHSLNKMLLQRGGHIGYGVLPRFRKKHYATEMLKLSLEYCKTLGLKYVLLDCDLDNYGSQRVIENNSGIKECNNKDHCRYWIAL